MTLTPASVGLHDLQRNARLVRRFGAATEASPEGFARSSTEPLAQYTDRQNPDAWSANPQGWFRQKRPLVEEFRTALIELAAAA